MSRTEACFPPDCRTRGNCWRPPGGYRVKETVCADSAASGGSAAGPIGPTLWWSQELAHPALDDTSSDVGGVRLGCFHRRTDVGRMRD